MNELQKMKELIAKIKEADAAYFQKDEPIMSDREYDRLVLELKMLERTTGIHFSDSPIGKVPGDEKAGLKTVRHTKPMLSCNKTKNARDIVRFAGKRDVVLSWKMDGLTLVLRYENGNFSQAITRGSGGVVGEDVTHTVKHMRNIPLVVPCKENFEVRGEGVLSWEDARILSRLGGTTAAHPRNVAAGAVRSLVPDRGKLAHLDFFAFELIKEESPATKAEQLTFLRENYFFVVEHKVIPFEEGRDLLADVENWVPDGFAYPVDGIVAEYDDIAYGKSLGATAHHERRMMALKWKDEVKETVFRGVELNTTRTGVVSIVGVFDAVEMDGTKVHRANLHNLSHFESFRFGVGDRILVYKANRIVPQIAENRMRSGTYDLPKYCPCCGEVLTVRVTPGGVRELYCPNEDCLARHAQKLARFCDKNAMDIDGLSASVLEKMMAYGWIRNFADIYHLEMHRDDILSRPGFGMDWYNGVQAAIEKSRRCHMHQFLSGIGIPHIGPEAARILHRYYYGSMDDFLRDAAVEFPFFHISGISELQTRKIHAWFEDAKNVRAMRTVMAELTFLGKNRELEGKNNPFADTTVAVTGTFDGFTREGILELLTSLGADVTEEITADTDYLIFGAVPSGRKVSLAMQYGVNVISEKGLSEMLAKTPAENR